MTNIRQIATIAAYELLRDNDQAVLVDVRTETEWRTVGVPDLSELGRPAKFVAWNDEQGVGNPHFFDQVTDGLDPDTPILLLCRSGARSNAAAEMLVAAGFAESYNIIGGFESPQDPAAGWKASLPATSYHDNL